jgi:hypothetical protein
MPVQKNLFPEAEPTPAPLPAPVSRSNVAPLWLQRISLFILVIFCLYLGGIVAILPWWTSVWDHNLFLQSHPHLWSVLRLGFIRGIISGLGLLDIWIGISEAIHYRDQRT